MTDEYDFSAMYHFGAAVNTSSIETATTTTAAAAAPMLRDAITSFTTTTTTTTPARDSISLSTPTPARNRPRPRPIFRKHTLTASSDNPIHDTSHEYERGIEIDNMDFFPSTLSIADRAKMRQRSAAKLSGPSQPTVADQFLSSGEHEESASRPTRPKPRPKKKPKLSTDNTTITTPSQPSTPSAPLPNPHIPTSQFSIPLPTSPPLPPSDPPFTPHINFRNIQYDNKISPPKVSLVPPIETLPNVSTPSSLFSADEQEAIEPNQKRKKRRVGRAPLYTDDEGGGGERDELVSDGFGAHIPHGIDARGEDDPLLLQPPSTFFAGSTPDSGGRPLGPEKETERNEEIIIDLCTVPERRGSTQQVEPKMGKDKGKKKRIDDEDEDFDLEKEEKSRKEKKPKPKPRPKVKEKKVAESPSKRGAKKMVGVVIESPTAKKKGKEATFDEGDVLDISDDDLEMVHEGDFRGQGLERMEEYTAKRIPARGELGDHGSPMSAVPDSEDEGMGMQIQMDEDKRVYSSISKSQTKQDVPSSGSSGSGKRRRKVIEDSDEDRGNEKEEEDARVASPKRPKMDKKGRVKKGKAAPEENSTQTDKVAKGKGEGKKGKRVVLSDEEEEEWEYEYLSSARKEKGTEKKARARKKGGKASRVLSETEDEEREYEHPTDAREETGTEKKTQSKKRGGKVSRVLSETEGEGGREEDGNNSAKENVHPQSSNNSNRSASQAPPPMTPAAKPSTIAVKPEYSTLTSRYTIAPKTKSLPMTELIRRVNSLPGSPFYSPSVSTPSNRPTSNQNPIRTPATGNNHKINSDNTKVPQFSLGLRAGVTAYSPYLKTSRSFLSKIAPLHPNRRTPPPPLPRPPPPKKSKKQLEREEQWEEEMIEGVGGMGMWSCMSEEERRDVKRAKWAMELGECD
ncbi:hypothetical protein AMATHDRAFT_47358 [Amanita thiersii Skay4041]|uniref:Uncharacterized protein n=1 Tax=Amanita thiersii Skay4041 TaxID=703135 RepID=A0A2A9NLW0_9AGAR|nr:hypothetical protein AMATHDRAFT_47358 [Amanita thiersii Skay4041]